jgi:hypothetical protein
MTDSFACLALGEDLVEGKWIWANDRVTSDESDKRIDWLVANGLEFLDKDWSGWEILYRDKRDRRLGELSFPTSACEKYEVRKRSQGKI